MESNMNIQNELLVYNTLTRSKERFEPLNFPHVGMYVCGPTVYNDAHMGNVRTYTSFDIIFRYLTHLGYKVRYVRNITDAGHLVGDGDEGSDKISERAKLMQLEPMEVVQKHTVNFHDVMKSFNILPPSIEPTATGHIIEQIELVKEILKNGYAYEVDGSVYFDVDKYNEDKNYGVLSGRNLDDLKNHTRELGGQDEKRNRLDFALWIKAKPEHLMKWPSPWGIGFPGWHLECSAMSHKYLGDQFDIHGGGLDLVPTHHTNEIAQNEVAYGHSPAKYWMHTNMLTINGQKMSKSLGNSILPNEFFTGKHKLLTRSYTPMTIRFFMLQAHYRSTLDLSEKAIESAEIGFKKIINSYLLLDSLKSSITNEYDVKGLVDRFYNSMNDDFNTPILLSDLFEASRIINSVKSGTMSLDKTNLDLLITNYKLFFDILGLKIEEDSTSNELGDLMDIVITLRNEAKLNKDFPTADRIRDYLKDINIQINDTKEGTKWSKI